MPSRDLSEVRRRGFWRFSCPFRDALTLTLLWAARQPSRPGSSHLLTHLPPTSLDAEPWQRRAPAEGWHHPAVTTDPLSALDGTIGRWSRTPGQGRCAARRTCGVSSRRSSTWSAPRHPESNTGWWAPAPPW